MPNPGPGYKGDWLFVEAYFKLNAIQSGKGVANGIIRYWFDGKLVIERTNVLMRTGAHASMKFNQLAIAPWIGDGSPADQTMWVDNLTIATDRVASGGGGSVPAPIASVAVTPGSVSQAIGGTQQFAASLKDASGNVVTGRSGTWTSSAPAAATVGTGGLETAIAAGSATISATSEGITGTASVSVTAPVITKPGTVVDLAVAGVTDTSATLSFTEVNDGTGSPASYDVRSAVGPLSWGSAPAVTRGVCATPLAGKAIGGKRTCTVLGLSPATAYGFQLIAFRGTLNVNAVFGSLSNSASGTTATGQAQQPQPPQQPQQPQPAPSGTWPHEPSGASVIGDQGFNSLTTGDGWTIADNNSGLGSVVSEWTAPLSPTGVLQYLYPVGFTGGTGPAAEWHGLPGLSQVFVGMWWKVSNPWQGHASNVNKIAFLFPGSGGDMYIAMSGTPGGPYELKVIPQFPGLPAHS